MSHKLHLRYLLKESQDKKELREYHKAHQENRLEWWLDDLDDELTELQEALVATSDWLEMESETNAAFRKAIVEALEGVVDRQTLKSIRTEFDIA